MTNETKRTPAIATTIDGTVMTITTDAGVITMDGAALADDIRTAAMMHGLKQKIVDAAAISRDPATGRSATVADKLAAMRVVADRLMAGSWNAVAGSGGGGGGLLFRALCELYPQKSVDDIRTFLAGKTRAEQNALRGNPAVAKIIDKLRAAGSSDDVDTDELLAQLAD